MRRAGGAYTTNFSEFTFGYALTRSLEARIPMLAAVPSFPSLIEEGQEGGGFDVRIERAIAPLFLQFKIPRVIIKPTSRTRERELLTAPYFRMYLHARNTSDQQRLLLTLADENPGVFYATPEFHDKTTIDALHQTLAVGDETAFFHPDDIGPLADDDEHFVAYEANSVEGWLCSDPRTVKVHRFREVAGYVEGLTGRKHDVNFFERLIASYRAVVLRSDRPDLIEVIDNVDREPVRVTLAYRASYLAQVLFDCQLLVVHEI